MRWIWAKEMERDRIRSLEKGMSSARMVKAQPTASSNSERVYRYAFFPSGELREETFLCGYLVRISRETLKFPSSFTSLGFNQLTPHRNAHFKI